MCSFINIHIKLGDGLVKVKQIIAISYVMLMNYSTWVSTSSTTLGKLLTKAV